MIDKAIALVLVFIILVTFVGNVLVCLSVIKVRKLRHPSNYLLISLAVSDLCVACIVMPFGLYQSLQDKWELGRVLCNIYVVSDVTSCTASILNLCVISIDRYLAITRPLTYCFQRTTKAMLFAIALVWALALVISVPALIISGNEYGTKEDPRCEVSQSVYYQLYATCFSFYVPLIVMIFIYYNIYTAAKRVVDAERRATTGLQVNSNTNNGNGNANSDQPPRSSSSASAAAALPNATNDSNSTEAHKKTRHKSLGVHSNSVAVPAANSNKNHNISMLNNDSNSNKNQHSVSVDVSSSSPLPPAGQRPGTSSVMRERKASITLGIIMSAFTICWLPFFIMALLRPFSDTVNNLPRTYVLLTLWLGYANSLLNPIIYVTFHRDFRNAFKHLLCLRCLSINEHIRRDEYNDRCGETQYQENLRKKQQLQQQQQLLLSKKPDQLL